MNKIYYNLAMSKLKVKSIKLYQKGIISKVQHMKNLTYISEQLDSMLLDQKKYSFICDIVNKNKNENDIVDLIKKMKIQEN